MWEDHLEGEEWRENVGLQTFHPVARDTHLQFNGNVNMYVSKTYDSCLNRLTKMSVIVINIHICTYSRQMSA